MAKDSAQQDGPFEPLEENKPRNSLGQGVWIEGLLAKTYGEHLRRQSGLLADPSPSHFANLGPIGASSLMPYLRAAAGWKLTGEDAMAYRDIDKNRFRDLLLAGVEDNELRKFFVDCKAQLIRKGARVQNLPHGTVARIRMIAFKLPGAADSVVQKWFSSNIRVTDLIPAAEVIAKFHEHEYAEVVLPEDLAKKLSRSCLVHLFSLEPLKN